MHSRTGDPFLAGGGAVELVTLDEVVWTTPPECEEAGSPNVLGAVGLGVAARELRRLGAGAVRAHDDALAAALHAGLAAIPGVRILGPGPEADTLPIATFTIEGVPYALVAARLSAEFGIGVRHGCFCAHPYVTRLLGVGAADLARHRAAARRHRHGSLPGAVRASSRDLDHARRRRAVAGRSREHRADPAACRVRPRRAVGRLPSTPAAARHLTPPPP